MRLEDMPEATVDWGLEASDRIEGASGYSNVRTHFSGKVRQRLVDYAPGYLADHWCSKGHVMFVLSGSLAIEHEDNSPPLALTSGMSWSVGDDRRPPHRVRSEAGARVFIID